MIKVKHNNKFFLETKREMNEKEREIVYVESKDGEELKLHEILKFNPYAETSYEKKL